MWPNSNSVPHEIISARTAPPSKVLLLKRVYASLSYHKNVDQYIVFETLENQYVVPKGLYLPFFPSILGNGGSKAKTLNVIYSIPGVYVRWRGSRIIESENEGRSNRDNVRAAEADAVGGDTSKGFHG